MINFDEEIKRFKPALELDQAEDAIYNNDLKDIMDVMQEMMRVAKEAEKKEINIQIGKRLQTARENSGYTQEVFAETLDVGVEHYRKIESGVYGLQPEKMLILYEKYRIEPTYLVTGDTNHKVDIELFLANCSREERDAFIDRMLAYMRKLMTGR